MQTALVMTLSYKENSLMGREIYVIDKGYKEGM